MHSSCWLLVPLRTGKMVESEKIINAISESFKGVDIKEFGTFIKKVETEYAPDIVTIQLRPSSNKFVLSFNLEVLHRITQSQNSPVLQ